MPPLAIAAALTSALIHASWNAALKGSAAKAPPDRVVDAFLIAVGGVLAGGVIVAFAGALRVEAWPYVCASVLIHLAYWFTLFKSYDAGDLSHIYTLSRGAAPLLVAIGAAFTADEVPPPVKAAGVALVSVGILLVGVSPNAPLRATLWALAVGLCIASYSLVDALGARISGAPVLYLGWNMVLMSVVMIAAALLRRGPAKLTSLARVAPLRGIAIGVISFAGYGLVLWAQTFAPIAQVTALRETSVVWGALIAFFLLGERLGARRWAGALVVAAGAALVAFA